MFGYRCVRGLVIGSGPMLSTAPIQLQALGTRAKDSGYHTCWLLPNHQHGKYINDVCFKTLYSTFFSCCFDYWIEVFKITKKCKQKQKLVKAKPLASKMAAMKKVAGQKNGEVRLLVEYLFSATMIQPLVGWISETHNCLIHFFPFTVSILVHFIGGLNMPGSLPPDGSNPLGFIWVVICCLFGSCLATQSTTQCKPSAGHTQFGAGRSVKHCVYVGYLHLSQQS